jgi:prophage regulatory protein
MTNPKTRERALNRRLVRLPAVIEAVGLSRASIYAKIRAGDFPRPVKLGVRAVGWRADAIERWIATRPSAGSGWEWPEPDGQTARAKELP